jgi:hypothetical protein
MATKPTKQQVAQGKARAGGNNPIKVTDAGLKKLGKAAVTAATLLPAGRAVKVAATATKAAKAVKAAESLKKFDRGITTEVIQKNSARAVAPRANTQGRMDAVRTREGLKRQEGKRIRDAANRLSEIKKK